ncbi:hypothetical protein [Streptomyces sp. NPDC054765]
MAVVDAAAVLRKACEKPSPSPAEDIPGIRTPRDHDGALNDIGTAMVGGFLGDHGPGTAARHHRPASGATAQIG